MKKIFVALIIVFALVSQVNALEVSLVGVVTNGSISVDGSYKAFGGDNPYYQTQYKSDYFAKGTAGIAITNTFTGALSTNEQFEVQAGVGRFLTKVGSDSLVNVANQDTGIVTGTLNQAAVGFGGWLQPGIVSTGITTADGITGTLEGQGTGIIKAGGVQIMTIGTSEVGAVLQIVERSEFHVDIGPGAFQSKITISFPK